MAERASKRLLCLRTLRIVEIADAQPVVQPHPDGCSSKQPRAFCRVRIEDAPRRTTHASGGAPKFLTKESIVRTYFDFASLARETASLRFSVCSFRSTGRHRRDRVILGHALNREVYQTVSAPAVRIIGVGVNWKQYDEDL